jgi:tetratricopeptide (TPR) repeat protein
MRAYLKIIFGIAVLLAAVSFGQSRSDALKRQGQVLMDAGRYGEAIDQLNKYIAANPRLSGGYHLRGLCYEKRLDYQYAVLDLRRALRLPPEDPKIKIDLDRVIAIWHKQLYQKIDGHKRDIAIDPKHAFSYLEIGKSYRWLEEWSDAEIWYDEYLKRDDKASPDEIIRYTEILAKTGSILKGERILKKYIDRYPDDWRIWSRYGFFTLWLGKNKIAENAFTKSLSYKPFFKEAEDGLDLAKREGYLTQYQGKAYEKTDSEYPIDRYYRVLKKNPEDDNMRFDLVNELIKNKRYDEAFRQLQYLQVKHAEEDNYKSLLKSVTDFRDTLYSQNIEKYTDELKNNPSNKEAAMKLAEAYGNQFYYDSAIEILDEYLKEVPQDQDIDARFMYSKYTAWNYEWEKSIAQLTKLIELDPDNLDYKLLRGQIGVWTVNDMKLAEEYLLEVQGKQPQNIDALLSLINLYTWVKDFPTAKKYLDIVQAAYPGNSEVENITSIYELRFQATEEAKIFAIRGEAGTLTLNGKCVEALAKYDEYYEKRKSLTNEERIEYADIANCAKDYNKAIKLYDEVLKDNYDYKVALLRAQDYFLIDDTTNARLELEKLRDVDPNDDQAQLFLADAYALTKRLTDAEKIYRAQKAKAPDEITKNEIDLKLLFLGGHYIDAKQFAKGKELYDEIASTSQDPEIQKVLRERKLMYAESLVAGKQFEEAKKELDRLELNTTNADTLNAIYKIESAMGYLLTEEKEFDNAAEIYDKLDKKITDPETRLDLYQKKMNLGDALVQAESYGDARDIYEKLLETTTDTSETRILKQRISWLPPSGFGKGLAGIGGALGYLLPTNIGVAPFGSFYRDNQKLSIWNYGLRLDAGFVGFLGVGGMWSRVRLDNSVYSRDFTQMKGIGTIYLWKYFSISGGYGTLTSLGEPTYNLWDVSLKLENPNLYSIIASYENTDARLYLYSPNMIFNRIVAEVYRFNGYYNYKDFAKISVYYNYFQFDDGNKGNDLQLRIGRRFFKYGMFGYEYFFSDTKFISAYYYSPQDFSAHSIWAESDYTLNKEWKFKAGGKIGYVPQSDFIISELFGEANYNPFSSLIISARLGYGNSFRYESAYRSVNASLSAYWGVF